MAIYKVYALRDVKAQAFLRPVFLQNVAVYRRALNDALQGDGEIAKHAEDYQAYYIGEFDDASGQISADEPPEFLFSLFELQNPESEGK